MIGLKNPSAPVQEQGKQRNRGSARCRSLPYSGGNSPGSLRRGSMAPCVAADEADGGVASQEERAEMRRNRGRGRKKKGKVLEGVCIGADDQVLFYRGMDLSAKLLKREGFFVKT